MIRIFMFFTLFLFAAMSAAEKECALHALLICDSHAPKLSHAYCADLERMKRNLDGIAIQSDLKLNLKILTGKQVDASHVEHWITKLPKGSNDVVLVYYVGRQCSQRSRGAWPAIKASSRKTAFSADCIAKRIEKRHPRLTLVFFDCYERLLNIKRSDYHIDDAGIPTNEDYTNIKPLFTKAKGTFMACSDPKGRKGFGVVQGNILGGVFTISLIDSIADNLYLPKWSTGYLDLKTNYMDILRTKRKPLIKRHVIEPWYPLRPKMNVPGSTN